MAEKPLGNTQDVGTPTTMKMLLQILKEKFKILNEPNLKSIVGNLPNSMQVLESRVSEILHNSIKIEAKQKELELWEQENIYKEAPNEGQKIIST